MNNAIMSTITCPITQDIMVEPVQGSDGKTYEKTAIIRWLQEHGTSPETRQPMQISSLKENYAIKYLIDEYNKNGSSSISTSNSEEILDDGFSKQSPVIDLKTCYSYNDNYENPYLAFNIYDNIDINNYKIYNDIVLIIDRSGSMTQSVSTKSENGSTIEAGFSIQDIVNHAAKTITNTLNDNDRITIISFDNNIEIVGEPFMKTTNDNKKIICRKIDTIKPGGQTAIWNAIKKGVQCINERRDKSRNASIMILTDGAPNISPARGEVETLKREKKENVINMPIYTFGFGYALQKNLLYELSKHGDGAFGHISDGGMIATVFNNFIANIMCTLCINVKLVFKFANNQIMNQLIDIKNPVKGDFIYNIDERQNTITINICSVQVQQYKSILLNLNRNIMNDLDKISYYLIYENKNEVIETHETSLNIVDVNNIFNNVNDYYRYEMINLIKTASNLRFTDCDPTSSISSFIELVKEDKHIEKEFQENMIKTLSDQVSKSVSMKIEERNYFAKWGEFYIEQLIRALNQQIKPNFKDNVCFQFGGEYFNNLVDKSSDIFDTMPPPIPSNTSHNNYSSYSSMGYSYRGLSTTPHQPIHMSTFNDQNGGCFSGHCLVRTQNNQFIQIKNLEKNTTIITFDPENDYKEVTAKVVGLIKINYKCKKQLIKFINTNLEITNYHPIFNDSTKTWVFPINEDSMSIELTQENSVYNVVLDKYHIIEVNSVKCITLGHNYEFDVLAHPYFGSKKVIEDLNTNKEFVENGFIEIDGTNITRHPVTNLINKII